MGALHPLAVAIGTAIRHAIADSGLTQAQFAEQAGMNVKTLGRRISGVTPFTFPEISAAADVTGTTIADLIEDAHRIADRKAAS